MREIHNAHDAKVSVKADAISVYIAPMDEASGRHAQKERR